jgi:flagellar biogenesis protein FliO
MPLIAWILVVWFSLSGFVTLASMLAKGMKEAATAAETMGSAVSILLTIALYGWLVWAVVRLATT